MLVSIAGVRAQGHMLLPDSPALPRCSPCWCRRACRSGSKAPRLERCGAPRVVLPVSAHAQQAWKQLERATDQGKQVAYRGNAHPTTESGLG